VCLLATRAVWLAWLYYFHNGPRYRLESAVIALVIVGVAIVLLRPGGQRLEHAEARHIGVRWLPVFLIAATCLYFPALGLGFLSDDYTLRAMAQSDGFGAGSGWFFRPLPLLLWRVLFSISDSAVLLHTFNVLLHGLNGFLVAALGSAMGMRRDVALGGAALFLSFPAAPEAVAWAADLQDVLMTTMALGAVVAARGETQSGTRIAVICVMVALGLGSKETAVCIPALIAICWLRPSRLRRWQQWRLYIALAVLTGVYLAIRVPMGIDSGYLAAPSRYFFKQLIVTAYGTLSTPWRAPTSPMEEWLAFVAVVVLVLLLVHALVSWGRADWQLHRDARLACWVLAAVGPVFTFFFVSPQLEGSRHLYLAECGWALLVADLVLGVSDRMPRPSLAFACAIGAAVVVSALSVEREIGVWRRAADLRDRVLAEAHTAMARQGCAEATFRDVPDSVDGAYVFRNGFREALGLANREGRAVASDCELMWRDGQFIARRP